MFSISSTYPTELEARLNAAEILGQELNTKMEKTEAEMEALKAADQGKHVIQTVFKLCIGQVPTLFVCHVAELRGIFIVINMYS